MAEFYDSPEQKLLDVLYDLQHVREVGGSDAEPAVFGDQIQQNCSVIIDKHTNDRIVLTSLPVDSNDFDGAAVWVSNPEYGVAIDAGQWQASPSDVIFWINKAIDVRYFNPRRGSRIKYDAEKLAERLSFPNIYPIPQSETDPRDIPEELEFISTPQTNTYTLASRISENDLEYRRRVIARRYGVIDYDADKATTFDLQIHEILPSEDSPRSDEFDREFTVLLHLGQRFNLPVVPWGSPEIDVKGNDFKIRVVREGMLISAVKDGKEITCIPTSITRRFIDSILHHASQSDGDN